MTENKGDLISREALKKAYFNAINETSIGEVSIIALIDNAPTVNFIISPDYVTELQNINKELIKQLEEAERPQGEWKLDDTEQFCYCDQCEDTYYPRSLDQSWNYCPHCGADMRGKE